MRNYYTIQVAVSKPIYDAVFAEAGLEQVKPQAILRDAIARGLPATLEANQARRDAIKQQAQGIDL